MEVVHWRVSGVNPLSATELEGQLKELDGVQQAVVDWKPGTVELHYDPRETDAATLRLWLQRKGLLR